MPKIIVVIENGEDGNPLWDEASIRQLQAITKPVNKADHQDKWETINIDQPHYSRRKPTEDVVS